MNYVKSFFQLESKNQLESESELESPIQTEVDQTLHDKDSSEVKLLELELKMLKLEKELKTLRDHQVNQFNQTDQYNQPVGRYGRYFKSKKKSDSDQSLKNESLKHEELNAHGEIKTQKVKQEEKKRPKTSYEINMEECANNNHGCGLIQLVACGAQDLYLTGNPKISFFKSVYNRYTNFSVDMFRIKGKPNIDNFGQRKIFTIYRLCDLIKQLNMEITLPTLPNNYSYKNYLGYRLIKSIELQIGGQRIDKLYSDHLYNHDVLANIVPEHSKQLFISQNQQQLIQWSSNGNFINPVTNESQVQVFVPIHGLLSKIYLPLLALQYHEVTVIVEHAKLKDVIHRHVEVGAGVEFLNVPMISDLKFLEAQKINILKSHLVFEGIYLDTDERRQIAQQSHEFLVQQTQICSFNTKMPGQTNQRIEFHFNHPVKYLLFTFNELDENDEKIYNNQIGGEFGYGVDGMSECFTSVKFGFDGHQRNGLTTPGYFREYIPRHCCGLVNGLPKGMYLYSFSLHDPLEYQPTGSCNYSKIDVATMDIQYPEEFKNKKISVNIYAGNVQVLRIMSGMGGLAYSK